MFSTIADIIVMTKRNLRRYIRLPQLLIFSTVQPVMFLLLFNYVFGGAMKGASGGNYLNFLLPGILVQMALFGSIQTGIGLADDLSKGLIDRFRSLPMARSAVLAGRTLSDTLRNVFVVLLVSGLGMLLGFRFEQGFWYAALAVGLVVFFGFAFSWVAATIGLAVKNTETAQVAGFIWVFPLVFASSIFVPVETMPGWLQAFAKISPVTVTANTIRGLTLTGSLGDFWYSILWIVGILFLFIPLAVSLYRRS